MSPKRFSVARLDEIALVDDGRVPARPVRHHLGIQAFGVNAWISRGAGESAINEHDEADTGEEELYLVLSGHAVFTVDGEEVDAPAGTLVFVEPAATRSAVAEAPDTTILGVGAPQGKPYTPSGWEIWSPVRPLFEAGEYDQVIERLEPLAEQYPQYSSLSYNLACAESLSGRADDAIEHLGRAIEADGATREFARNDPDFDGIRDDPRFAALVAEP